MSIKVQNITKTYGAQKALNEVSFEIHKGEIVAFLGPNGAGKSTMMKIITGYISQNSGEAFVNGINISKQQLKAQKEIGYLPEHNPLYLNMYVKEYLYFIANIYKLENKKEQVQNVIKKTGLTREAGKKIGSLSKGYRQRVGIAQAIIHNPSVLILDEPTTGLDPNQIVEIRDLIKEIGKEKTVLLSTHLMQEVEAICNRVIIIDKGRLIANDTEEKIRQISSNSIFVEFNEIVELHKLKEFIPQIVKVDQTAENSLVIDFPKGDDIRENIFDFAVNEKIKIRSLFLQNQSIEKTFIDLTN
jgi:ABC-2 type transport system ATP-binding protein